VKVNHSMRAWAKTCLSSLVAASFGAAGYTAVATPSKPTWVEVWSVGDDALSLKLREAVENAFQSSPRFRLSSGKKPGTLVVTIPTHVGWRQFGKRTQVSYRVEFASADQHTATGKGSCWDDGLAKCAAHIVADAEAATKKLR
jgi:hypothetical protein